MKKMLLSAIVLFSLVTSAFAQDVRRLSLDSFVKTLELSRYDQSWDFGIAGRPIVNYTVVQAPAERLSVKFMYNLVSENGKSAWLATTTWDENISIRDGSGQAKSRPSTIRIMFTCNATDEGVCREQLASLLKKGTEMQSLGVSNHENPSSDVLPEGNMILGFLLRESGKF